MNDSEITRLIELAGRATPGERQVLDTQYYSGFASVPDDRGGPPALVVTRHSFSAYGDIRLEKADAEFIAAANPDTIRSLADEVLRLREVERLAGHVVSVWDGICDDHPERRTWTFSEDTVDALRAALASLPSPEPAP